MNQKEGKKLNFSSKEKWYYGVKARYSWFDARHFSFELKFNFFPSF
jgi:hypothetical protein